MAADSAKSGREVQGAFKRRWNRDNVSCIFSERDGVILGELAPLSSREKL